jgi:phage baseplate assembly protein W
MSFDLLVKDGDLVISNGDFAVVTGTAKLQQDLLKIALTEAGGDPANPWYGSLISKSLIGTGLDATIVISVAQSQLQTAIQNLKNLQALQTQSSQSVDPSEAISFVKNISIIRNKFNPTQFDISISVLSRAFGQITASFSTTT